MAEVFENNMKNALQYAHKLKLAGETELSKTLCLKCVKRAADYNGSDMIELFYGERVYNDIKDVADAMRYIFIAKCAADAYAAVYTKNEANATVSAWAKRGNDTSDKALRGFFEWLQRRNRAVEERDYNQFKVLINSINASEKISFKMSDRVAHLKLIDIIYMVVSGSIIITSDGELR